MLTVFTQSSTSPYMWSLLLSSGVVFLSIAPLTFGRIKAGYNVNNMAAPRALFDKLPAFGKRAVWAHQNCFESFSIHAPSCLLVLLALLNGAEVNLFPALASLLHPVLRVVYIIAYVGNIPPLRGLCWAVSTFCSGILYLECFKFFVNI